MYNLLIASSDQHFIFENMYNDIQKYFRHNSFGT